MRLLTSACVDGSRLRCKLILSWHDRHSRAAGHVHLGLAAHVALGLSSLGVIFFRARSFIPRDRAPRAVIAPRVEAVLLHTVPRREEAVHAREHEARLDLLRRAALHEGLPSSPVTSSPRRICSASPSPSPPSWRRKVLAISGTVRATRQTRRSVTWPRKSWHGATKSTVPGRPSSKHMSIGALLAVSTGRVGSPPCIRRVVVTLRARSGPRCLRPRL